MTDNEFALRRALQHEQQFKEGRAPDFAAVWEAAEAQARPSRKRAIPLALALISVVAVGLLRSGDDLNYVDDGELLGSTSWTAPSDALLPERQFDIFREIPRLIESTEPLEGALL